MKKMSKSNTTKKVYRVVLYTYHFSAELEEFSHMGVDPYQLETTPLSSYGDKREAEALLKRLQEKYPEEKLGLQSSFAGGCRLAAGAKEALEWGRTYRVSEMDAYEDVPASPYDDEYDDEYDDDEYDDDEDDEYEDDEYEDE